MLFFVFSFLNHLHSHISSAQTVGCSANVKASGSVRFRVDVICKSHDAATAYFRHHYLKYLKHCAAVCSRAVRKFACALTKLVFTTFPTSSDIRTVFIVSYIVLQSESATFTMEVCATRNKTSDVGSIQFTPTARPTGALFAFLSLAMCNPALY